MFKKLEDVTHRFDEIERKLMSPGLASSELTKLSTERAHLLDVVTAYRHYCSLNAQISDANDMMRGSDDAEMRAMAKEELEALEVELEKVVEELKILSLPRDPKDDKNVILEVRAGTGGEEASLFAADLFRMYTRFADNKGWRTEVLSVTASSSGGIKEAICQIIGHKVFSHLKFESGVHRVQRVPETEAQGRVHTSACTVAVLPEADDVEVSIDPKDLEITTCRASGAGGQHINKTDSAIRIVHLPTGLVVECQDERSQHKNKERALKILNARLLDKAETEQAAAISADRRSQVGSGDRSERIRTYNFPQGRVTDHRINLTLYKIAEIINGDLTDVIEPLMAHQVEELLKQANGQDIISYGAKK